LARWGKKLLARKGSLKLAVAAVARKLTVAIWYLLNGKWTSLEELDERLALKLGKIITQVGSTALRKMNKTRRQLRQQSAQLLISGRVYLLDPNRKLATQSALPRITPAQPHWLAA